MSGRLLHAGVISENTAVSVDAPQLAASYQQDSKAADAQYRGKKISITGVVKKIQQGERAGAIVTVYLESGPGLPAVKVDITDPRQFVEGEDHTSQSGSGAVVAWKHSENYRVQNNCFEIRDVTKRIGRFSTRTTKNEWQTVLKCNDKVAFQGDCTGKALDILITNGTL